MFFKRRAGLEEKEDLPCHMKCATLQLKTLFNTVCAVVLRAAKGIFKIFLKKMNRIRFWIVLMNEEVRTA